MKVVKHKYLEQAEQVQLILFCMVQTAIIHLFMQWFKL